MRILYVLNAMGGGASAGIYEFLPALPRDEFVPYAVIPPGTDAQFARVRPLFEDVHLAPLTWWRIDVEMGLARRWAKRFGQWRRGMSLERDTQMIRQLIADWQIDLVHSGTAMTLSGALAAQAAGVPHIWHIKEAIGSQYRVQFPKPDPELVAYMSGLSAQIVTMSDYIAQVFRAYGCPNLSVVPDGVNFSAYDTGDSHAFRAELGVTPEQVLVGMVASLDSTWKQHDIFIRMVAQLAPRYPHVHFVIAGKQPPLRARWPYDLIPKYYRRMRDLAGQLVPPDRLTFSGHFPDPADIMRSLDILVHPCSIEPFGRIAIEAQTAGTPVVGPDTGGISETVRHAQTGLLVPANDVDAFAQAVARLIEDVDLRAQLGRAGQTHARENYTIERMIERLRAIYRAARH